jgi:CRISPR-associated protein Cas2
MMMLITYDVSLTSDVGSKRLRHISKTCLDYGIRVQYSVFECEVTPAQWVELKAALLDLFDPETDSLRFYHLGAKWKRKVEHHGAKATLDIFRDTLIL